MTITIPYTVTIYRGSYMKELYVSATGTLHTNLTEEQIAAFASEENNQKDTQRNIFKEHLTEYLREIIAKDIERREQINDYAPFTSSSARLWAYVRATTVILQGTISAWKANKGKVLFTGTVEFCFT